MVSYSSWNGVKNHGNGYLINTVLKGQLGFPASSSATGPA